MFIAHHIARIEFAVVYKIIDRKRKIPDQHATLKTIAVLQRRIATIDRPERATALKFDDTLPVGQPCDVKAIARLQICNTDAVSLLFE